MNDNSSQDQRETSGGTLSVILTCITLVCLTFAWLAWPKDTAPTFEGIFSAVNALFSGLAFATLIFTVFMQRQELALQRQELRDTREELKRSATAQEASETALRAQAEAAAQSAHLSTVNALLSHYRTELLDLRLNPIRLEQQKSKYHKLQEREDALISLLDIAYHQVTTAQAKRDKEPFPIFPVPLNPENRS